MEQPNFREAAECFRVIAGNLERCSNLPVVDNSTRLMEFMAAQFAAIRESISTINTKLDRNVAATQALDRKLDTRTSALELKIETRTSALELKIDTRTSALELKIDTRTSALERKIDSNAAATKELERKLDANVATTQALGRKLDANVAATQALGRKLDANVAATQSLGRKLDDNVEATQALGRKLDAKTEAIECKLDSNVAAPQAWEQKLDANIAATQALDRKFDAKTKALERKLDSNVEATKGLGHKLDTEFDSLNERITGLKTTVDGIDRKILVTNYNTSIKLRNRSIESPDAKIAPLRSVITGKEIEGFPKTANEIDGLKGQSLEEMLHHVGVPVARLVPDRKSDLKFACGLIVKTIR